MLGAGSEAVEAMPSKLGRCGLSPALPRSSPCLYDLTWVALRFNAALGTVQRQELGSGCILRTPRRTRDGCSS